MNGDVFSKGCPAMRTSSFQHWKGGARWHQRQGGYFGHVVQVVDDFGDLIAVRGKLVKRAGREALPFYPLDVWGEPMYCVCDHAGAYQQLSDLCPKCPYRPEHREAAIRDVAERRARELKELGL